MDKKELQKKLSQSYSTENWQEVVQFVFPNVQILNPPMVIPIDNEKVEQFRQLGNVQLHDGKSLALFELKLKENVNIIRNRVELNNIVSQYIDQDQTHGVLSIFEKGGDDYRFTFSASASEYDEEEGDFVAKKTDTKRFTYVLGKNESCKTPAQRFYELSENKNKADIAAIENAFSVEKLSKAFFKEYKDQYTAFVNYMMQTPSIFKAIYSEDDKAIRDFVKILLGRIIFIKFVQKKGWMGVEATSKKWIDGDYRFLENGFANFKHQDLFYSTFLEPLFDALDQPNRPNDIFTVTNTRVPYLSGGLFELEDKKTKNINFPANYFAGLFEFLDRYNFTIDENDTNDHEVGIDPEMLGHIFENLLEDNKDKGAFYTPKEIVRYMCQESLKEYLKTSLENNKQWPTDETEAKDFEQALYNFVTKKEAGGIIEFEETIARALKEVKICDPAIGSGAFPMGLLNEIFQLVHKLHEANKDKVERVWELQGWQPNLVKQNIIQNSIYGVDIEKGAVDVARLRFWLSLIVDEPEPKALPHLDYKIVVGNSLVSKLDDTIIDIDWEVQNDNNAVETDLFGKPKPKQFNAFEVENDEKQKQLLKEISAKQKLVFDPNSDEEKLSLQIRNLKIDLLVNQLDAMVKTKGVAKEPTGTSKTIKAQTELWLQTLGWQQQITKLQKLKKQPEAPLHFFDWKLDFPEIMNEQVTDKVGFDIIIGNPPYISYYGNTGAYLNNAEKKYFTNKFDGVQKENDRINSMNLFTEVGLKLCKRKGRLAYIVNKTMAVLPSYSFFREYVINNSTFDYTIIDLSPFEAIVDCLIFGIKNEKTNNYLLKYYSSDLKDYKLININTFQNNAKKELLFSPYDSVLSKIEKNNTLLENFIQINRGVNIGGCFEDFLSITKTSKEYKKYLPGTRCIKKFIYEWNETDGFMIFDIEQEKKLRDNGSTMTLGNIERFQKPKLFIPESGQNIMAAFCNEDMYSAYGLLVGTQPENNIDILLYCCGLLNSNLFSFYCINRNILRKGNKSTPHVGVRGLNGVPIPNFYSYNLKKFIKIIESLISSFDINNFNILNNLVYKLYELTYDEVLVVEPEFAERMSKEDYEGLQVE